MAMDYTLLVPISFKPGDIVSRRGDRYFRYILRVDIEEGKYHCDGSTFNILDQDQMIKVNSISDMRCGDLVRVKGDPRCYTIHVINGNSQIELYSIHGDGSHKIVHALELCDNNYHPFNFK